MAEVNPVLAALAAANHAPVVRNLAPATANTAPALDYYNPHVEGISYLEHLSTLMLCYLWAPKAVNINGLKELIELAAKDYPAEEVAGASSELELLGRASLSSPHRAYLASRLTWHLLLLPEYDSASSLNQVRMLLRCYGFELSYLSAAAKITPAAMFNLIQKLSLIAMNVSEGTGGE